jgi:hypothetical protein
MEMCCILNIFIYVVLYNDVSRIFSFLDQFLKHVAWNTGVFFTV